VPPWRACAAFLPALGSSFLFDEYARHLEDDAQVCEPRDSYENMPAFPARPEEGFEGASDRFDLRHVFPSLAWRRKVLAYWQGMTSKTPTIGLTRHQEKTARSRCSGFFFLGQARK
jgi:hypothetical protein